MEGKQVFNDSLMFLVFFFEKALQNQLWMLIFGPPLSCCMQCSYSLIVLFSGIYCHFLTSFLLTWFDLHLVGVLLGYKTVQARRKHLPVIQEIQLKVKIKIKIRPS